MARDDPHFRLRLPSELKAEIESRAERNGRSINSEIVSRLQATVTMEDERNARHQALAELRDRIPSVQEATTSYDGVIEALDGLRTHLGMLNKDAEIVTRRIDKLMKQLARIER